MKRGNKITYPKGGVSCFNKRIINFTGETLLAFLNRVGTNFQNR